MNGLNLFDPTLYSDVRRPLAQASLLPAWCYSSPEFYERERDRIFKREWNPVGRVDDVPDVGDYFTTELVSVPLMIVRGQDGTIRAFINSCRHRGTEIVCGRGNQRVFSCPYHSWCYSLEGKLLSAPGMEGAENFDRRDFPLTTVKLETWAGFLFVNLDPDSGSVSEHLGDLKAILAPYDMAAMVCVRKDVYDLRCNWKLLVENFKESYHLATVHRTTIDKYASIKIAGYDAETPRGQYLISFARHSGSMALFKDEKGFPPIDTLTGKVAGGSYFPLLYPALCLCTTVDCCWYLEMHPQSVNRTRMIVGSLFPKETVARPDFEEVIRNYYKRWDTTIGEDNTICERQQRGLDAGAMMGAGRCAPRESNVHAMNNWILDRVVDKQHHDATAKG